jgi:hypothetical protein
MQQHCNNVYVVLRTSASSTAILSDTSAQQDPKFLLQEMSYTKDSNDTTAKGGKIIL